MNADAQPHPTTQTPSLTPHQELLPAIVLAPASIEQAAPTRGQGHAARPVAVVVRCSTRQGCDAERSGGPRDQEAHGRSEPGVDGLALHREDAEHALVNAVERLATDEPFERLDAEPELAYGE